MSIRKQEIKENITGLDWILNGTVLKQHKKCGKINCQCMKEQKYWHGPYYVWTRKEKGKTITRTLTIHQAKECQKAFKNMKTLDHNIEIWKKISLQYIEHILEK